MPVLVVRHGLSEANVSTLPAYGKNDAPLMAHGIAHAAEAGLILRSEYGVDPSKDPAAASNMLRSQQTAQVIGFSAVKHYAVLNEVNTPKSPALRIHLDMEEIIPEARRAAELVLENPPEEKIWFTHGYLIAALCDLTGADTSGLRFIPRFGEIRELPI